MDNPTVVLGYSRSKGQYRVDEIRGDMATVTYQHSTGVRDMKALLNSPTVVQMETITVHVGDWLLEGEANNLGIRAHLIVRPYRQVTE